MVSVLFWIAQLVVLTEKALELTVVLLVALLFKIIELYLLMFLVGLVLVHVLLSKVFNSLKLDDVFL